jgi:hypothetical protein
MAPPMECPIKNTGVHPGVSSATTLGMMALR